MREKINEMKLSKYILQCLSQTKLFGKTLGKGKQLLNLDLETICQWALIKGIDIVSTGDFTHPKWIKELEEKITI
ncbi:MAG TPA: hypothetical protein VH396_02020 [Chitinophagaceae bacterium]